jgi:hypothetical protein
MAISGYKTQAVFKRCNIVSGRDIKEAATKLESYLGRQRVAKPVATRRRRRNADNSGTIGQATPLAEKRTRVN